MKAKQLQSALCFLPQGLCWRLPALCPPRVLTPGPLGPVSAGNAHSCPHTPQSKPLRGLRLHITSSLIHNRTEGMAHSLSREGPWHRIGHRDPSGCPDSASGLCSPPGRPGSDRDARGELPRHTGVPCREDLRPSSHPTACQEVYFHC